MMTCNRTMLSVAGLPMSTEFGWSPTQFALLQSAYLAGYPLTQLLCGTLADILGAPLLFSWAVLLWYHLWTDPFFHTITNNVFATK